jgi:hypothetical protein
VPSLICPVWGDSRHDSNWSDQHNIITAAGCVAKRWQSIGVSVCLKTMHGGGIDKDC